MVALKRTRGVLVSVLGGEPQVHHSAGTVAAVIVCEKLTVSMPSVSDVVVVPSAGIPLARLVVPAV